MTTPTGFTNHYETLGLSRDCTTADIREAFRRLSKRHHPDANGESEESVRRTQALNAAHEILRDPARRRTYDEELLIAEEATRPAAPCVRSQRGRTLPIKRDVRLTVEEFLRGLTVTLTVADPASPGGPEIYRLDVPPGTAPKARFKIPRTGEAGGNLVVTLGLRPHPRFKARGTDLRCDLRLTPERAASGGPESLTGPDGRPLHVQIPARAARGEVLRLPGHGLPRSRGGRGDLLVRLVYRPEVQLRFQKKG